MKTYKSGGEISQCIIDNAKESELGDIFQNRFELTMHAITNGVIVEGDENDIRSEYRDYKCWTKFHIDLEHSWYEYFNWMGSCGDLARNNFGKNLKLTGELKLNGDEVRIIMENVLPSIKYEFGSPNVIIITLDDIASNL